MHVILGKTCLNREGNYFDMHSIKQFYYIKLCIMYYLIFQTLIAQSSVLPSAVIKTLHMSNIIQKKTDFAITHF